MNTAMTNDLIMYVAALAALVVAFVIVRIVILPSVRHKKALKKADEITQRRALARLDEIRTAENNANDPWSQTCSHDTIQRELTKSQILSLEKIGQSQ